MKEKLLQHYKLTSFLSGWLLVATLPPFYLFPLLFISLSSLLWLINSAPTSKQAFKSGYYYGFAFFAFGFSWVCNALALDLSSFGWLIPLTLFASGIFFGLFIAIPSWLCWYFRFFGARFISFAALWVIFEWVRSFFLTGFPWNLLGSCFAFSDSLLQTASLLGSYGLSFIAIIIGGAPFLFIVKPCRKNLALALILIIISLGLMYGFGHYRIHKYPYHQSDINIRLVQPAIPQTLKWNQALMLEHLDKHLKLSRLPQKEKIDFVIWGETAFPFDMDYDIYQRSLLQYAIPEQGYLITGAVRRKTSPKGDYMAYNSLFIINHNNQIVDYYDKSHLVPFGEYIPLRNYLPSWVSPIVNEIGTFQSGTGPKTLQINRYPPLGGLICYEIIFPHRITDNHSRPQWIVNITNDGWYGNSAGPYQHLVSARLRAVEEGITIVRVAGSGISALISPTGQLIGKLALNQSGILDVSLPLVPAIKSYYGHYGNILPLIICFLSLFICLLYITKK